MALPDLIEIVPLSAPVRAEITVPGSKSITNRALILAALADGEVTLKGALWSEDTQVMTEALQALGFQIRIENDPDEFCNRTITVKGLGGKIPNAGTPEKPLELFVGNAGTAARFLSAFVCLGGGVYRLSGVPRMHERPQAALFSALRELGYLVESEQSNDKLPVKIFSGGSRGNEAQTERESQNLQTSAAARKCRVSIAESSQFASALLLSAKAGGWEIEVVGENADESPYVAMTSKLIEVFLWQGGAFQVEPDASSGSYFWAANWLVSVNSWMKDFIGKNHPEIEQRFHKVWEWVSATRSGYKPNPVAENYLATNVRNWPVSGWQIDADFPQFIPLPDKISRDGQLGDSIMTAIVLAADLWGGIGLERREKGIKFTELGRLRLQECDRVTALKAELSKCGANVVEDGDMLTVFQTRGARLSSGPGSFLHGAEVETYNDHRMAMCFAVLGLKVPGIKIKNPACVKKTFPNFFQKFAAAPPQGLGVTILDAMSGRKLTHEELFAD
jgi:3-phosphoshikimate 1-carboxyvinyltransferase